MTVTASPGEVCVVMPFWSQSDSMNFDSNYAYLRRILPALADGLLATCIRQGYVPPTCRLAGFVVWNLVNRSEDPCAGCSCPRDRCHGRPMSRDATTARVEQSDDAREREMHLERLRRWANDVRGSPL